MKDVDENIRTLWGEGKTLGEIRTILKINGVATTAAFERLGISKEERTRRSYEKMRRTNPAQDEAIYQDWCGKLTYAELSRKYHLSDKTIMKILKEKGATPAEANSRRGMHHRVKRARCCACGILLQYCSAYAEVSCKGCRYADGIQGERCPRRRRHTGVMCEDCQKLLNVKPLGAGNQEASTEGG